MLTTTHARQGDTVDLICRREYGGESGYVERVLEANSGLADLLVLPLGTAVVLPDVDPEEVAPTTAPVTLWG